MSIIIGLDPGASTGVATFSNGALIALQTCQPHQIRDAINGADRVVFEDSRLTSFMFTTVKSRAAALKMARNVGEIDAWCRLITELCAERGIPAHGISPQGKGKKLNAAQFAAATGWTKDSNQHTRDAAMVAYPYRRAVK